MPGDVDIVIASELMEAGRAVQRGLVTPDRTTFIVSTNRVYAMTEKIAMADGRVDSAALLEGCRTAAKRLISGDMAQLAESTGSMISSVLFGALAGANALPMQRMAFEAAIRRGGVGVKESVAAFDAGFAAATDGVPPKAADAGRDACLRRARAADGRGRAPIRSRRAPTSAPASSAPPTTRTPPTRATISTGSSRSPRPSASTATARACCSPRPRANSRSAWPTRTPCASPS